MPDITKIQTPNYDPENPRCDKEQLNFLKDCIAEGPEGIKKWNKWYDKEDPEIWLQKAHLSDAHLERAFLYNAHLEGSNFWRAYLEKSDLHDAHLEGAKPSEAHLAGAKLYLAHLEEAEASGAHFEGADLFVANLKGARLWDAHLEGADLHKAHLERAGLHKAHLEGADLHEAHLKGANLHEAHLEGANLQETDFRNANISDIFLQRANFRKAIVDGSTLIWGCKINKRGIREKNYTDFAGVGLDSVRIQPQIKQLLEYNIRKSNWYLWYEKHPKLKWLVRPFWLMNDYGMSTGRIILTFLILASIFATVYFSCGTMDYYLLGIKDQPGIVTDLFVPVTEENQTSDVYYGVIIYLRSLYFSVVTMTTLGFGDMFANTASFGLRWWLGHLLLIVQVILGYILLGALVTRFAVLFTAGGPAGKFAEKEK